MITMTKEEALRRLQATKLQKQRGVQEAMEYLRKVHYAETGKVLKDSDFHVW